MLMKVTLKAVVWVTPDQKCCSDGNDSCPHYQSDKKLSTGHKCTLFDCTLHPLIEKGGIPLRCSECVRMQG